MCGFCFREEKREALREKKRKMKASEDARKPATTPASGKKKKRQKISSNEIAMADRKVEEVVTVAVKDSPVAVLKQTKPEKTSVEKAKKRKNKA